MAFVGIVSALPGLGSCATNPNQAAKRDEACPVSQAQAGQAGNADSQKAANCVNRSVAGGKPASSEGGQAQEGMPLNPVGKPGSSVGWGRPY